LAREYGQIKRGFSAVNDKERLSSYNLMPRCRTV